MADEIITLYRGDILTQTFLVKNPDGTPYSIPAGDVFEFLYDTRTTAGDVTKATDVADSGFTTTDESSGALSLTLTASETADLALGKQCRWWIRRINEDSPAALVAEIVHSGKFTVLPGPGDA